MSFPLGVVGYRSVDTLVDTLVEQVPRSMVLAHCSLCATQARAMSACVSATVASTPVSIDSIAVGCPTAGATGVAKSFAFSLASSSAERWPSSYSAFKLCNNEGLAATADIRGGRYHHRATMAGRLPGKHGLRLRAITRETFKRVFVVVPQHHVERAQSKSDSLQ